MGPSDYRSVDQWSVKMSKETMDSLSTAGVVFEEAPLATPGSISTVERYHAPSAAPTKRPESS